MTDLPEKTTLTLGEELIFQCKVRRLPQPSQVECSPLCGISWIVGEEEELLTGASDLYSVKEQYHVNGLEEMVHIVLDKDMVVEQSEDHFSFVDSTLSLNKVTSNLTQFSVSCRWRKNPLLNGVA